MLERQDDVPPSVYLIADNLDAALASGEDLTASAANWVTGDVSDPCVSGAQRWVLTRFKAHELNLVARIVQARMHIGELSREVPKFRPLAQLFISATADLDEAFEELHEQVDAYFDTGGGRDAYLRSRGLLDLEAAGLADDQAPVIGDDFLVAAKVPLGVCLDLIAEFLDSLDGTFDLYPDHTLDRTPDQKPDQTPNLPALVDSEDSWDVA